MTKEEKYKRLIMCHEKIILKWCDSYSQGDTHLYEEMIQEVMYTLWVKLDTLQSEPASMSAKAWVKTVSCHTAAETAKRQVFLKIPNGYDAIAPDETSYMETFEELTTNLNPEEKELLKMHLDGFTYKEISKQTGFSKTRISLTMRNALRKMEKTAKKNYRHEKN